MNAAPEAAAGRSLPSKEEILAFQDRWLVRAGLAAIAGALIIAVSIGVQRVGLHLPNGNSDADKLAFAHAHSSRLIYSSILQGIGFILFALPLAVLFRSAASRAQRVRNAFYALVLLGPLAFGVGVIVSSAGSAKAASDFVKQEPAVVQSARQHAAQAQASSAKPSGQSAKPPAATGSTTTAPSPTAGSTTTATGSTTTGTTGTAVQPKSPDQAAHDAREGLADHLNKHTTVLIAGGLLSTIGVLALVFAMIYTNLWCMRLGLLTRFWGAVGMAFGLFLIIPLLPPIPGLVLWFAVIGLMLAGLWPRALPPAWAAAEAVPWPTRSQNLGPPPEERGPGGTVEGSGREVSESPLPEQGEAKGQPPDPPYGETQGQRRKKRKRRG